MAWCCEAGRRGRARGAVAVLSEEEGDEVRSWRKKSQRRVPPSAVGETPQPRERAFHQPGRHESITNNLNSV